MSVIKYFQFVNQISLSNILISLYSYKGFSYKKKRVPWFLLHNPFIVFLHWQMLLLKPFLYLGSQYWVGSESQFFVLHSSYEWNIIKYFNVCIHMCHMFSRFFENVFMAYWNCFFKSREINSKVFSMPSKCWTETSNTLILKSTHSSFEVKRDILR